MHGALVQDLQRSEEGRLKRFFLRRLRNAADAADATQETFLRMLTVPPRTIIENPQAYLFQVARSVARVSSARAAADATLFDPDGDIAAKADDAPGQERIVQARQSLILLARAIESLPNRCQEVFILSRLHGLPNGEIATRLGISRNMVEKHIIKALIRCRAVRLELFF
ncbi:putative RNA polymerase sigma factor FecI [bacterium YEK0313]|nr:putative RNA polymerase sigma factor FecI [bacterium YEK0313]